MTDEDKKHIQKCGDQDHIIWPASQLYDSCRMSLFTEYYCWNSPNVDIYCEQYHLFRCQNAKNYDNMIKNMIAESSMFILGRLELIQYIFSRISAVNFAPMCPGVCQDHESIVHNQWITIHDDIQKILLMFCYFRQVEDFPYLVQICQLDQNKIEFILANILWSPVGLLCIPSPFILLLDQYQRKILLNDNKNISSKQLTRDYFIRWGSYLHRSCLLLQQQYDQQIISKSICDYFACQIFTRLFAFLIIDDIGSMERVLPFTTAKNIKQWWFDNNNNNDNTYFYKLTIYFATAMKLKRKQRLKFESENKVKIENYNHTQYMINEGLGKIQQNIDVIWNEEQKTEYQQNQNQNQNRFPRQKRSFEQYQNELSLSSVVSSNDEIPFVISLGPNLNMKLTKVAESKSWFSNQNQNQNLKRQRVISDHINQSQSIQIIPSCRTIYCALTSFPNDNNDQKLIKTAMARRYNGMEDSQMAQFVLLSEWFDNSSTFYQRLAFFEAGQLRQVGFMWRMAANILTSIGLLSAVSPFGITGTHLVGMHVLSFFNQYIKRAQEIWQFTHQQIQSTLLNMIKNQQIAWCPALEEIHECQKQGFIVTNQPICNLADFIISVWHPSYHFESETRHMEADQLISQCFTKLMAAQAWSQSQIHQNNQNNQTEDIKVELSSYYSHGNFSVYTIRHPNRAEITSNPTQWVFTEWLFDPEVSFQDDQTQLIQIFALLQKLLDVHLPPPSSITAHPDSHIPYVLPRIYTLTQEVFREPVSNNNIWLFKIQKRVIKTIICAIFEHYRLFHYQQVDEKQAYQMTWSHLFQQLQRVMIEELGVTKTLRDQNIFMPIEQYEKPIDALIFSYLAGMVLMPHTNYPNPIYRSCFDFQEYDEMGMEAKACQQWLHMNITPSLLNIDF